MASWILVPSLVALRAEFDALAPNRSKASDGSVGDQSHASNSSDHNPDETGNTPTEDTDSKNEVHAIDVDKDLRRPDWTMQRCVDVITTRHRTGLDDRLQNVIYDRRIWSASWGWTARPYGGANAHTEHGHFSARYTTGQEEDVRPWGLLEQEDDVSAKDVWTTDGLIPNPAWRPDAATNSHIAGATALQVAMGESHAANAKAGSADRKLDQVLVLLQTLTGKDFTDEPAIIAGVLAGLDPAVIAAAIPPDLARRVADELATRLQG